MKTQTKILLPLVLMLAFAGYASASSVTGDALEDRTSFALGLDRGDFTISDRVDDGVRTSYMVKTNQGKVYSCYVTGAMTYTGPVVSDAICNAKHSSSHSGSNSSSESSCNALLHAAGRC